MFVEPVRRSFRRFVRLDCQVVRETDLAPVADLVLDLSLDGMLVRGTRRLLTGEELVVSFRPPRSNQIFDAVATVARVVHGRRPGDYGLSFGLEFHGVDESARALLFDKLRGMNAPDPSRPPRPLVPAFKAA